MLSGELVHSGEYILSTLVGLPLVGALVLLFVNGEKQQLARNTAVIFSTAVFVVSLILLSRFVPNSSSFQFVEKANWLPAIGASYLLGVDGLSLWLVVLTSFLTLLVLLGSKSIESKTRAYVANLLVLESGMLGALLALDGVVFYVFWEMMLIPMYFLIGVWGHGRKVYAAIKFVLYTAFGSLLMLVAIVYLANLHQQQFGQMSFYLGDWMKLTFSSGQEKWLFAAFALAFAIKIPVFPLHTWLPDAHVEAPTGGSVILAGVLLKMGLYGLIRFALPVFPNAMVSAAPLFALLGVIGIVYGALVAWVQTDMKKLVAYSSVSHLGFCVLGFAALNMRGMQGCVLQMLNHGISTAALFFMVGMLYDRRHTRLISEFGGIAAKVPVFAFVFLVFTLSSIGLPLTNGFVGEFLILLGSFEYNRVLGAIAVSGVILGAMYMLSMYRRVLFGPFNEAKNGDLVDLNSNEKLVLLPLLLLVFYIGLYPQPILRSIEPSSYQTLSYIDRRVVAVAPEALQAMSDTSINRNWVSTK